ncbi:MAG: xanthine dehydrogenase family protein molybdopterin-binding subunit [Deltaproteobacteria bacterium]|nr:xanthine dehydrogenase family protein molybdopterin-binding subunit [Deltaproteobacteria bacterium]MBI2349705.1 xanthine dehydrogenase family protein molybdopterin-binding subunit [Deltaproteobacteria bacterium]MBI2990951.1 xanthine dehydrogenase family protein molybdopterin-binding subunit [Deltaproteobacteria bacterium]
MEKSAALKVIGHAHPRVDGEEKVTGRGLYAGDIELPGMAYGKILRSPFPHARVLRVDARKAERYPGVLAVLTRENLSGLNLYYGAAYKDQPIVAVDKVRYAGDAVAAVVAVDEAGVEEALALIEVEYEELPAVTSIDEALRPDAALVHESAIAGGELHGYHYQAPKEFQGTNVCYRFQYSKGDVAAGFKKSAYVFEDTFTFPRVQHFSMEPHVTVAHVEGDRITLWASTQDPFTLREHIADIFRVPLNKVRVIVPHVGGGYGGKLSVKAEPLAAALSWKARRPVKLALSVEESFKTVTRHPARFRIKTGVSRDGRLLARECEIYMDTGAYADAGPRVTQKAGYRCFGPYRVPHMKTSAYTVYTNTAPAGAFRGFGTLQVTWAYESQMDIIARRLGIDALDFRLKNLLKKGESYTPGDTPVDCDLKEGLRRAAGAIGWGGKKSRPDTGKGLSCCMKDGGGTYKVASAAVKMNCDGSIVLLTGTVEIGQGARTALSQVVAEEMGVPLGSVVVAQLDTDVTPYDAATNASSSMVVMGLSVQRAAQDLKRQLLKLAAKELRSNPQRLRLKNGRVHGPAGRSISLEKLLTGHFGARGGDLVGRGSYQDKKSRRAALGSPTTFWEVSWGAVEVEVSRGTGEIRVLKYVSIADVGRAVHPVQCEGQDEGAVMFAIGHTLLEEMIYKDGQLLNPNLVDYRVPTFRDLPRDFKTILIENRNGPGPFGSKGMGEGGLLPVAPAIGNAVYNAVGVRLYDLPITPERLWRAMREKTVTR